MPNRTANTTGDEAKAELAREAGADAVCVYAREDFAAAARAFTGGRGVDVAYDPVGGDLGDITRRLMAWEGRLVVVGFASGRIPDHPANHVLVKNYAVVGLHWGAYVEHGGRAVIEAAHEDLLRLYRAGSIRSDVTDTVPLADVPHALAALEARAVTGRLVVTP